MGFLFIGELRVPILFLATLQGIFGLSGVDLVKTMVTLELISGGIRGHIGDGPNFFTSRKYFF